MKAVRPKLLFPLEGKTVLGVNLGQPMSQQTGPLCSVGLEKLTVMSHTVKQPWGYVRLFDFERPYEKEENRFNLGAINAQTLRSEWTILLYILDCKYEEEKEISFCSFLFFGNQNRNFETDRLRMPLKHRPTRMASGQ